MEFKKSFIFIINKKYEGDAEYGKPKNIGEILRVLRIAYDLSITDLSEKIRISKSYITEVEKGKKNPSYKILEKYQEGLNIPKDAFDYMLKKNSKRSISYQKMLLNMLKDVVSLEEIHYGIKSEEKRKNRKIL